MNEIEWIVTTLVFGLALGLFVAHLQSRICEDVWKYVRIACGVTGGISIIFFIYFGYMLWYLIGAAFFFVVLYEPHEKDKHPPPNRFQFRRGGVLPRFRNPYSRREERLQLEEWL